jgi:hypothetical protein
VSQRLVITVAPSGETTLRTEGFTGSACQRASQAMERALGTLRTEQLTQDFYQTSTPAGNQQLDQGAGP